MKKIIVLLLLCSTLLVGCEGDYISVEGTIEKTEHNGGGNSWDYYYIYLDGNRKYELMASDYKLLSKGQEVKLKVKKRTMLVSEFQYLDDINKKESEED